MSDRFDTLRQLIDDAEANGEPVVHLWALWEERVINGHISVGLRALTSSSERAAAYKEMAERLADSEGKGFKRAWIERVRVDHLYGYEDLNQKTLSYARSQVARWRAIGD